MKHHTPRKRTTARSRAATREPLAALKNPRPPVATAPMPPPPALDWDSEEPPPAEIRFRGWHWLPAAAIVAVMVLAWWWL